MFGLDWSAALLIIIALLAILLLAGQWVSIALVSSSVIFLFLTGGWERPLPIGGIAWETLNSFVLTAVPLFIFMGEVIARSGLTQRLYDGILVVLRKVPGNLLHANIGASAVLAAMSGSSSATAAAMARIALPQMERDGYDRKLSFASIAGGGSLGMLIPPSLGALLYGAYAELSVSRLFMAGLVPGIVLALMISAYLFIRTRMNPALAPTSDTRVGTTTGARLATLLRMLPGLVLVLIVLGSIYSGLATPTEAAAIGAGGAVVIGFAIRGLSWRIIVDTAVSTAKVTSALMFIVVGAHIFSAALVQSGVVRGVLEASSSFMTSPWTLFICMAIVYVVLGMFIDGLSLMFVTLPVVIPLMHAVDFNPYLFGVLLVLFIELGQITPPVGIVLYIISASSPGSKISEIFRGAFPVVILILVLALLIFIFPDIALWLPEAMST
ncbi:TRAP transporter large permease [Leucobacter chinensis]|uniref:TRAP transporter large permease n=1 Tax=Leucobacter chinensis TaxID=2851010 RepID=UPI001C23EEC4|nr:TRAP transporter large permease [Leucobacter chinensis]